MPLTSLEPPKEFRAFRVISSTRTQKSEPSVAGKDDMHLSDIPKMQYI